MVSYGGVKTTIKSQLSHQESAAQSSSNLVFHTNFIGLLVPEAKLKRRDGLLKGAISWECHSRSQTPEEKEEQEK